MRKMIVLAATLQGLRLEAVTEVAEEGGPFQPLRDRTVQVVATPPGLTGEEVITLRDPMLAEVGMLPGPMVEVVVRLRGRTVEEVATLDMRMRPTRQPITL